MSKICERCGKKERKIQGHGLCTVCYLKEYRKKNHETLRIKKQQYHKKNKLKIGEKVKLWQKNNPEKKYLNTKKWRANNREKVIAAGRINDAIRYGKLKRKPCEICGEKKSHGHHPDYSKPLLVIWLCPFHHKNLNV